MYTFTKLESEYLRTQLYGPGLKRREVAVVKPLLEEELGDAVQARMAELDKALAEIRQFGEEAKKLAADGCDECSLGYDLLFNQAKTHSDIANAYMRYCYAESAPMEKTQVVAPASAVDKPTSWPTSWKQGRRAKDADGKTYIVAETTGECMYQYCFFGLWDDGEARDLRMQQELENYRRFSDDEAQLAADKEFADEWLAKARKLLKKAKKSLNAPEVKNEAAKMKGPLLYVLTKQLSKEAERRQRSKTMTTHKVKIHASDSRDTATAPAIPAASGRAYGKCSYRGHCNDIFLLRPAKEWELYVDESGDDAAFNTGGKGVIAGVLTDLSCQLPEQPQLHASSDKTEELMLAGDRVVQTILENPQTGVLAIPARAYRNSGGWGSLIVSLVDLVLRMLPLDGKTKLTVFVEGRSPYDDVKDFTFMRDACRYQLMHTLPERAALIDFDIRKMGKGHPRNAYPDIVSHTCCMCNGNPLARDRYRAARWGGACYLDYDAMQLCSLLDYYHSGRLLPAADWDALIRAQRGNDNFVAALLQTFGEEVRGDVDLWRELLDVCLAHLDSKAINLYALGRQIDFLKRFRPDETGMPPRVRLLWLTAKLAEANHRGVAVIKAEKEFMQLIGKLFEEDAPLACFAVLHLAVARTNAYKFQEAGDSLEKFFQLLLLSTSGKEPEVAARESSDQQYSGCWIPAPGAGFLYRLQQVAVDSIRFIAEAGGHLMGTEPAKTKAEPAAGECAKKTFDYIFDPRFPRGAAAIPGARYFAQLVSSHGQHEAFLGRNDSAVRFFVEAIRRFRLLSDSNAAGLDISQTSAYLLTSLMDVPEPDPELLERTLREYFGDDPVAAARRLAADDSPENKYRHHILLRLIHSGKAAPEVKAAYLAEKDNWAFSEDGHPWEMIAFYRALLLDDRAERIEWLQKAFALTAGADATLHVIGAVILGAMLSDDGSMADGYGKLVERCAQELPDLGERLQVLREQPRLRRPPLELAKLVLPFNFR